MSLPQNEVFEGPQINWTISSFSSSVMLIYDGGYDDDDENYFHFVPQESHISQAAGRQYTFILGL